MALTKKDLEEMMAKQKEERLTEMTMLKNMLMESVKHEIKKEITVAREVIKEEIVVLRDEVDTKVSNIEKKQTEMSDIQSIFDCRVDKLEEEIKSLKHDSKSDSKGSGNLNTAENDAEIAGLVEYATKIVGFKPIEARDISRMKRMNEIEDTEEATRECLREFWRCELRMSNETVEELLDKVVKIFKPDDEEDWDRLFVQFEDEKSVKTCYSYCKYMKNTDSQILQYFPLHFRDQYRTLDSIAYKLRKPDDPRAARLKTRIRYGQLGLELEQRHPDQRNWTKVQVDHLPAVDLSPVPPPKASSSPPCQRTRSDKRPRSPQGQSPTSAQEEKRSKVHEEVVKTISVETDLSYDQSNIEKDFSFQTLKKKFSK